MDITEIKVFLVDEPKLKAFVSIVLDRCFMVNDIKVIKGRDGLFVSMPSRRKKNGQFKDIAHPLNNSTRAWLEDRILAEYRCSLSAVDGVSEQEPVRPLTRRPSPPQTENEAGGKDEAVGDLEQVRRRHLTDSFWNVG